MTVRSSPRQDEETGLCKVMRQAEHFELHHSSLCDKMWKCPAEAMVLVIQKMLKELRQMTPQELHLLDLQLLEATAELLSYLEVSNLDLHPEDVEEASLVACGSA
ncbi:unnamed protein product [Cladocopium goreaui]|uniref:Uncharacterized protein n=1 Tax=Cladocopium goreaui TaxID=2562237 RepID=A0A9P1D0D1_9DINO|nr:unnamed protein product [Cladocopium goreaui]